jgi:hypothetical protein
MTTIIVIMGYLSIGAFLAIFLRWAWEGEPLGGNRMCRKRFRWCWRDTVCTVTMWWFFVPFGLIDRLSGWEDPVEKINRALLRLERKGMKR